MTSASLPSASRRTRLFGIGMFRFRVPARLQDALATGVSAVVDGLVYLLGPLLIIFAAVIISGLSYSFFGVVLPMLQRAYATSAYQHIWVGMHVAYVVFILVNVIFNYALCVMSSNKGENYQRVVRELADATGFLYPETPQEVQQCKQDYEDRMLFRLQRRQARSQQQQQQAREQQHQQQQQPQPQVQQQLQQVESSSTATTTTITQRRTTTSAVVQQGHAIPRVRRWMLMGPQEWGFCVYSNQPKPPRSHYDHVTRCLVLNMDHYCPWMFNTVGYFNYRYFCNFLFFVFWGMFYGAIVTFKPFRTIGTHEYVQQHRLNKGQAQMQHIYPWVPTPEEHTAIAFSFMLCLSVGLAVLFLGSFHAYLVLTAQTTVEFHGNYAERRRAKQQGKVWVNPYDLGVKRNWQQLYGMQNPILAMLPSSRQPEFLPVPMAGDRGRRRPKSNANGNVRMHGADIV